MRFVSLPLLAACLFAPSMGQAQQQQTPPPADDEAFTLGQIVVTAPRRRGIEISGETLRAEAIQAFNKNTLDEAIAVIPGVTGSNSGGSRNERLIFVRGFDRFQVPLSIDGIRVYLPADNRLDYGRFLTPDIAEIQVAKGYASVIDGPGAMGGAINLVTSKPTRQLEGDLRATLDFDRSGNVAGHVLYGRLGGAAEHWYAQASYARNFRDHWSLSGRYRPGQNSAEDGGRREFSRTEDWRINVKAGYTPNASDEYALSYTRQEGAKNAPLHVTDPVERQRFWTWPYWNIDSLYFLSTTAIADGATLKTRIYRNGFDNLLRSFDTRAQDSQTVRRAFNSYYRDRAWGGSAELGIDIGTANRLMLAAHYRRDRHSEWQQGFPGGAVEPEQNTVEDSYSLAAENRFTLSPYVTLIAGVSHDWRHLERAEEYGVPSGEKISRIFNYPLRDNQAFNAQAQLLWAPDNATRVNASISSRTRFPTIFERFSTQFGTAASNPDLKPERATNFELGVHRQWGKARLEAALFYSRIGDAIVSVRPKDFPDNSSQRQNLGNADYYGGEIGISAALTRQLDAGVNYSYIHRDFAITGAAPGTTVPVFALTDVPAHKAFAYAEWRPLPQLRLMPSMEIAGKRMTVTTASPPRYYETGGHALANMRVSYAPSDAYEISAGVKNLFDENYSLSDGFPEAGRSFYLTGRVRF